MLLIRRPLQRSAVAALIDNGTVGWFFSGVTILYGLLLGLLTVATWQNFTQASALSSHEAAQLSVLYRNLGGYAPTQRQPLRDQLRRYTAHIVERSWPLQRQGLIDDSESDEFLRLQTLLLAYAPDTVGHELIHQQALQAFNDLAETRRLRVEAISGGVPAVIWWVVLIGALVTLVFSGLFVMPSFWFHGLLTSLLGIMLGLLIFLIVALDHPYWGEVSVGTKAYELVLQKVMIIP
ncbi:hypothetical protein GCM10028817_16840 [Spirosoma pomorum]